MCAACQPRPDATAVSCSCVRAAVCRSFHVSPLPSELKQLPTMLPTACCVRLDCIPSVLKKNAVLWPALATVKRSRFAASRAQWRIRGVAVRRVVKTQQRVGGVVGQGVEPAF